MHLPQVAVAREQRRRHRVAGHDVDLGTRIPAIQLLQQRGQKQRIAERMAHLDDQHAEDAMRWQHLGVRASRVTAQQAVGDPARKPFPVRLKALQRRTKQRFRSRHLVSRRHSGRDPAGADGRRSCGKRKVSH